MVTTLVSRLRKKNWIVYLQPIKFEKNNESANQSRASILRQHHGVKWHGTGIALWSLFSENARVFSEIAKFCSLVFLSCPQNFFHPIVFMRDDVFLTSFTTKPHIQNANVFQRTGIEKIPAWNVEKACRNYMGSEAWNWSAKRHHA